MQARNDDGNVQEAHAKMIMTMRSTEITLLATSLCWTSYRIHVGGGAGGIIGGIGGVDGSVVAKNHSGWSAITAFDIVRIAATPVFALREHLTAGQDVHPPARPSACQ